MSVSVGRFSANSYEQLYDIEVANNRLSYPGWFMRLGIVVCIVLSVRLSFTCIRSYLEKFNHIVEYTSVQFRYEFLICPSKRYSVVRPSLSVPNIKNNKPCM